MISSALHKDWKQLTCLCPKVQHHSAYREMNQMRYNILISKIMRCWCRLWTEAGELFPPTYNLYVRLS